MDNLSRLQRMVISDPSYDNIHALYHHYNRILNREKIKDNTKFTVLTATL